MGDTNVGIGSCPSFFPFHSFTNRNTRYMAISAMLELKKDSYLIISQEKFKIKRSKIKKTIAIFLLFLYCSSHPQGVSLFKYNLLIKGECWSLSMFIMAMTNGHFGFAYQENTHRCTGYLVILNLVLIHSGCIT